MHDTRGARWPHRALAHPDARRALGRIAGVASGVCVLGSPLVYVLTGSWPAARFLAFYVAPLLLAVPLWLAERLREGRPGREVWGIDIVVVSLSLLRFVVGPLIPMSGHMLFL